MTTFLSNFIFSTFFKHIITIYYALFTNNNFICFEHPLCTLRHFTYLIASHTNIWKSIPLIKNFPSLALCFFVIVLLLPSFHSFQSFHFSLTLLPNVTHHQVFLCLALSFVHPQVLSVVSNLLLTLKTRCSFWKPQHRNWNHFWYSFLLMQILSWCYSPSFFFLGAIYFPYPKVIYQWFILNDKIFTLDKTFKSFTTSK